MPEPEDHAPVDDTLTKDALKKPAPDAAGTDADAPKTIEEQGEPFGDNFA